ncbi:MAG: hypothetical protein RI911_852 [Candidatus Parcubacteria bacterium]|jgi:hypothetical protein
MKNQITRISASLCSIALLFSIHSSTASAALTVDLQLGSKHVSVKELQSILIKEGILPGPASGYFGSQTRRAVQIFQQRMKLQPTGIVNAKTRTLLNARKNTVVKTNPPQQVKPAVQAQAAPIVQQVVKNIQPMTIKQPQAQPSQAIYQPTGACGLFPKKVLPRATEDRPDENQGYKVHFVYVLPKDGVDQALDTNGTITTTVQAFTQWLCEQTQGKGLPLDTYDGGLDITFLRLDATDDTLMHGLELPFQVPDRNANPYLRDDLEIRFKNLGLNDQKKIYAVYYGGTSNFSCGGGPWPPNLIGRVTALFINGSTASNRSAPKCQDNPFTKNPSILGYREYSMIHEILHAVGAVPKCAPHHTLNGHVSDSTKDIMYQGEKSWELPHLVLDVNRDDYYKTNNFSCYDISNNVFLGGPDAPPGWPR